MARQHIKMKTQNHIWQSFSHLSANCFVPRLFCDGQDIRILAQRTERTWNKCYWNED